MISILVFLVIFGILILVHEFGHFIVAKRQGVKVECFSLGFGPCLLKRRIGDTDYRVNIIPLGGYVKLAGDNLEEFKGGKNEYFSKTPLQRAKIIFFGPLLNYLLGFVCFWVIFVIGYPSLTSKVGGLLDGYGAQIAGVKVGDRILMVDGKQINSWDDLQELIYTRQPSEAVRLKLLREGKEIDLNVSLRQQQLDDQLGDKRKVGLLGVTPDTSEIQTLRYGVFKSMYMGLKKTWALTTITYKALWRMITGSLSVRETVTGPIGIFYITARAAQEGVFPVLNLVGILSISLAIFNLLPLPILDGGHIFLLLIEKFRGKQLSLKTERVISQAGFLLIITLAVVVTYNDILRFFGDRIAGLLR